MHIVTSSQKETWGLGWTVYIHIYIVTEREGNMWDNITVNNTVNIFQNV